MMTRHPIDECVASVAHMHQKITPRSEFNQVVFYQRMVVSGWDRYILATSLRMQFEESYLEGTWEAAVAVTDR